MDHVSLTDFYKKLDCAMVCFPAAFTIPTGELHWSILNRSLAINNQLFITTCSPARNKDASYHCYGHSMVTNPMGIVMTEFKESSESRIVVIDIQECKKTQKHIPILDSTKYL